MRAKSPSPSSIRSALLQVCRASPCSWLRLVMDGAGRPGCSVPSPICWRISAARCRAPYGNGPGPGGSAERRLWNALDSLADLRQQTERLSHAHPVAPRADPPAPPPRPRVRTRPAPPPSASSTAKNRPTRMRGSPAPGKRDKTGADRQSERLYAPLVLPGRCTPYVRAHCHTSTRSDTH